MKVSITLEFASALDAAHAMARLSDEPAQGLKIAHDDRPDVGAPEVAPLQSKPIDNWVSPAVDPVALFGTGDAAAPAAPTIPTAPSTAGAAVSPTVPVAPPAGVPLPPPAASLPVPPAPTAAAPTAPVAPTTSAGAERDVSGLPWDARIHAGNKAKNKDGTWRQRRGLNDEALAKRIEAELRATVAGTPAPAATAAVPPATPAAAVPPAPPAPPATPAAPVAGLDFGAFMGFLAPHLAADFASTNAKLGAIFGPLGIASLGALSAVPHLIPVVKQQFEAAAA